MIEGLIKNNPVLNFHKPNYFTTAKFLFAAFGTITFFGIAMGLLETAVVIYLRKIYYPHGFSLPLVAIDKDILFTEILREAATIIMLLTVGIMAGKTKASRFAYFIFCFGVWDIFYYVFLELLINWPASLLEWDILFLIPIPWFGPVIAPCIISLTMIVLAVYIVVHEVNGKTIIINKISQMLLLIAGFLFVWSCIHEYVSLLVALNNAGEMEKTEALQKFVPQHFGWLSFWLSEIFIAIAFFIMHSKTKKVN